MANNLVRNGNEFNAVLPPHGSVAEEMQALLWRLAGSCTAFHLVPAAEFADLDRDMESDVVVLGDEDEARDTLMDIVEQHPEPAPARRRVAAQRGRHGDVRARCSCPRSTCATRGPGQPAAHVDAELVRVEPRDAR